MGTLNAGRTPYPTGPGYVTPGGGPALGPGAIPGYLTPGGVGYGTLNSQGYNTMGSSGGYNSPAYGIDDMHRQYGPDGVSVLL